MIAWRRPFAGRATLATYTVNHQPWMPGPELPYVVAIVEIDDDTRIAIPFGAVKVAGSAVPPTCKLERVSSGAGTRLQ